MTRNIDTRVSIYIIYIRSAMSTASSSSSSRSEAVPYRSSRCPARFLIFTGVGHTAVGLLIDNIRVPFLEAVSAGYVNQFTVSLSRHNSFWYFLAGVNLILLGKTVEWYLFLEPESSIHGGKSKKDLKDDSSSLRHYSKVRSERVLPRELGVWFLGIGIGGAAAIPKSGFYLLILQGLALLLAK